MPMSVALLDTNPCLFTLPNLKCANIEIFDVAWGTTVHQTDLPRTPLETVPGVVVHDVIQVV